MKLEDGRMQAAVIFGQYRSKLERPGVASIAGVPRKIIRKRTATLKDVGDLAAVDSSTIVRLENGTATSVSSDLLIRAARAVGMEPWMIEHVLALYGRGNPLASSADSAAVTPDLHQLLEAYLPRPAYVINGLQDILAWNEAVPRVFEIDLEGLKARERNVLRIVFGRRAADFILNWSEYASRAVDEFKQAWMIDLAARDGHAPFDDPFQAIHDASMASSDAFHAEMLRAVPVQSPLITKVMLHPDAGRLDFTRYKQRDMSGLWVIQYVAADSATNQKLELLHKGGHRGGVWTADRLRRFFRPTVPRIGTPVRIDAELSSPKDAVAIVQQVPLAKPQCDTSENQYGS